MRKFALLFAALFLVTPAVFADGPRIIRLSESKGPQGHILTIHGENFSENRDEVTVTFGGEPGFVLNPAAYDKLLVQVPQIDSGEYDVEVTILGRSSNKKSFEIMTEEEWKEMTEKQEGSSEVGSIAQPTQLLRLSPRTGAERGKVKILVTGDLLQKDILPEGASFLVTISYYNNEFDRKFVAVKDNRFQAIFGPYDKQFLAGPYAVEAVFRLNEQHPLVARRFQQKYAKDKDKREAYQQIHAREFINIGRKSSIEPQLQELVNHYTRTIEKAEDLLRKLDHNFVATGRSLFRQGQGDYDRTAWEKWARRRLDRISGQTQDLDARMEKVKGMKGFLTDRYFFQEADWREWIDHEYRGEVRALHDEHEKFRHKYVATRFPKSNVNLSQLIGVLVSISMDRSEELYRKNGLGVHQRDKQPKGWKEVTLPNAVELRYFRRLANRIKHEIKLKTPMKEGEMPEEGEGEEDE